MKADTDIRRDVQNEMHWDPSLNEGGIGVAVKDGVVTLFGEVAHFGDRWTAEEIAKRVSGVRAIANEIEVKIPASGERSDSDIANAAATALKWNVSLAACEIQAVVRHGWIALTGQVQYGYQRITAENAVRSLMGVKGISNEIVIKPTVQLTDVKRKIEEALPRVTQVDNKLQGRF